MNPLGMLLRGLLLLMGLVVLLSVLAVALLLMAVWLLRALWARLTGKPVQPWAFQILRQAQWSRFYGAPGPGATVERSHGQDAEVIDVEARPVDAQRVPHNAKDR
jgi:hypothetical protein